MATSRSTRTGSIVHVTLVLVIPAALFAWLFARFLLNDLYLVDSDLYEHFLPAFLSSIRVWSSFEFSGLPVFADPGDYFFYPPNLLFRELIPSWTLLAMSAYVVAAWATYAYVYSLTHSKTAAAVAAAAYSLSETMMERLAHLGAVNAIAWLPLMALAVDRVRGPHPRRWMAVGAFAIASSILAGHAQPTLYALYCLGLYALTGLIAGRANRRTYARTAGMVALGVALAAVKVLPAVEASTLTARQDMSFGRFVSHALTVPQSLSVLFPTLLHGDAREAPTYAGLVTVLFALVALCQSRRQWRVVFWGVAALFGLLMGLGENTPVARLAYYLPLYDKFRVGSRHLFLFAFGIVVLAGFGVAAVQRREVSLRRLLLCGGLLLALLAAGATAFVLWPGSFQFESAYSQPAPAPFSMLNASIWSQMLLALVATALAAWIRHGRGAVAASSLLLLVVVCEMVRALPYDVRADGLELTAMDSSNAAPSVHAIALDRDLRAAHQRALAPGGTQSETVLPAAFSRLWQIPIAGGYGPMLLDRYSQVAMMGTSGSVNPFILANEDTALDLLAVRYLLLYNDDLAVPPTFERNGMTWAAPELGLPVGRPDCGFGHTRTISLAVPPDITLAGIALVTHLECSEDVPQGTTVAKVKFIGASASHESLLRAGVETAEGDLGDAAVRGRARHAAPPAFEAAGDSRLVYEARLDLPAPAAVTRIEIEVPPTGGWLIVDRLTLIDAAGHAYPQSSPHLWLRNPERWREVRRFASSRVSDRGSDTDIGGERPVTVVENLRAAPRAWIVPTVVPVRDADALAAIHYSQLPDGGRFDVRAMAVVDVEAAPPILNFASGTSSANVTRIGDGQLSVVASTQGGGFLVLSENYYPGWRASIDDMPVPVYRVNMTLQGVVVPAGLHRVRFELRSTTLRAGYVLSGVALIGCLLLSISEIARRTADSAHRDAATPA
jgi:hypothetical protein